MKGKKLTAVLSAALMFAGCSASTPAKSDKPDSSAPQTEQSESEQKKTAAADKEEEKKEDTKKEEEKKEENSSDEKKKEEAKEEAKTTDASGSVYKFQVPEVLNSGIRQCVNESGQEWTSYYAELYNPNADCYYEYVDLALTGYDSHGKVLLEKTVTAYDLGPNDVSFADLTNQDLDESADIMNQIAFVKFDVKKDRPLLARPTAAMDRSLVDSIELKPVAFDNNMNSPQVVFEVRNNSDQTIVNPWVIVDFIRNGRIVNTTEEQLDVLEPGGSYVVNLHGPAMYPDVHDNIQLSMKYFVPAGKMDTIVEVRP